MRGKSLDKILRRGDGSRVRLTVNLGEYYRDGYTRFGYTLSVVTCKKGKRTWCGVVDADSYTWRQLSMEEREQARIDASMNHITEDELHQAKLELWESIKPIK